MIKTRLALTLCAAALTLGACATKPKALAEQTLGETPASQGAEPQPSVQPPVADAGLSGAQAELAATAGDRVFFGFDSHVLDGDARATLVRQAAWLSQRTDLGALIAGSADERGTREYNLALGARRAAAARAFLVSQGVAADRLDTISYGKEQPVDSASGEDAWAKNRNAQTVLRAGR